MDKEQAEKWLRRGFEIAKEDAAAYQYSCSCCGSYMNWSVAEEMLEHEIKSLRDPEVVRLKKIEEAAKKAQLTEEDVDLLDAVRSYLNICGSSVGAEKIQPLRQLTTRLERLVRALEVHDDDR